MIVRDLLVRDAEALVARGQSATALSVLRRRRALALCAAFSAEARDQAVTALVAAGDIDDAFEVLATAVFDDVTAVATFTAVVVSHSLWRQALTILPRLVERYPDHEAVNGLLVFASIETGAFERAVAAREAFSSARRAAITTRLPEIPADERFTLVWELLSAGQGAEARRLMAEYAVATSTALDLDEDVAVGLSIPGAPRPPTLAGPKRALVLALTVRDEVDILAANLEWHFAHGIDGAIITDNGSVDGTRALLDELSDRLPIVIIDEPVQDMDQSKWSTRMVWLAREAFDADWVLLGDADEFFQPEGGSFQDAIASATRGWAADATVLAIDSHLMLLDADIGMAGPTPFHAATRSLVTPLPRWSYAYVTPARSLLPVMTQIQKVWVRAASLPIVLPGNHLAISRSAKLVPAPEITCLHFSYRDFERWLAKQTRFADGFARNTAPIDRSSVDYWAQHQGLWADPSGAEAMYRRLQFGTPFHHYLAATGRIIEQPVVRDFVINGARATVAPLSAAERARCREVLADLDARLPRCVR